MIYCFRNMIYGSAAWYTCLPQVWYNIRSLHTRSVYHLQSRHHIENISSVLHRTDIIIKNLSCLGRQKRFFIWWERVDSDHRSHWQQIYSLPPLATRERSHMELVNGVEPSTCWLQISCSAIEPHQHFYPPPRTATAFAIALPLRRILVYHKGFFLSIVFWKYF